jgi:hypothetical protein
MADDLEIPNIGALLRPVLSRLPASLVPAFLAGLERSAADRYRRWADAAAGAEERQGLLACSRREDQIAERVKRLFPLSAADEEQLELQLPEARRTYLEIFDPHPVRHQYRMQASAEREGAAAWRSLAASHPDPEVRKELEACAELEESSATWLEGCLSS